MFRRLMVVSVLIALIYITISPHPEPVLAEKKSPETIELFFYNEEIEKELDGTVFIDGLEIGRTKEGRLSVDTKDIQDIREHEIKLEWVHDNIPFILKFQQTHDKLIKDETREFMVWQC